MLAIQNLSVTIQEKNILKNISLNFEKGKNYCLLGKNGSGKSSLAMTIMGHPKYQVTEGDIRLDDISIKDFSADKRAKLGIFLAFQQIPEIKGVKLFEFLRAIYDAKTGNTTSFLQFKQIIEPLMQEIDLAKDFLWRDLNVGFSGGERRKLEILQIKLLEPNYIFLDEIDSGLDVDAFKTVAALLSTQNHPHNSLIIITHIFEILNHIPVDHVCVLDQGKVSKHGDQSLADDIKQHGFAS